MIIRPADRGDVQEIAQIWNPMIRDTVVTFNSVEKTEDEIWSMIQSRQAADFGFWVACQAGGMAGFVTYGQFRGGVGYRHAMEHTIILAPTAQGWGTGRRLMATCEEHAKSFGHHTMLAGVSGENGPGITFHAKLDYELVAVIPQVGRKFGRWMDLHLMQKFL